MKTLLIWNNSGFLDGHISLTEGGRYIYRYPHPIHTGTHIEGQSYLLPAFFANRVMNHRRPEFETYKSWLGLAEDCSEFDILGRVGYMGKGYQIWPAQLPLYLFLENVSDPLAALMEGSGLTYYRANRKFRDRYGYWIASCPTLPPPIEALKRIPFRVERINPDAPLQYRYLVRSQ